MNLFDTLIILTWISMTGALPREINLLFGTIAGVLAWQMRG